MTDLRGWRLCPRCGADVELDPEAARCPACGYAAYANPAPALCALVLDGSGRVLLGRRAREPFLGCWDVLGGFANWDEDAVEALRRELREEAAIEVELLDFLGGFADRYGEDGGGTLNFFWTALLVSGEPRPDDDVAELRWFGLDELPPDEELAFANSAGALAAFRALARGPQPLPSMFEVQLVVADLDACVGFYRDVIGLTQTVDDRERGRAHFRLDRGQLILARVHGEPAAPDWPGLPPGLVASGDRRGPTPDPAGPAHFALEVAPTRLFAEGERLRGLGLDVRGPLRWPDGFRSLYVRDPEGNVAELIAGPR